MAITLQFLGAARHVTGSKHLLSAGDESVLLDCGLVQGPRSLARKLNMHLSLDPTQVDAVVLSHAHIDHSGSLPRLVKLGFGGKVHCTHATADLAAILLEDSARIQAADARYLARKRGEVIDLPYDVDDVRRAIERMERHDYHEPFEVARGVTAEFFDAGHILGSAMVVLDAEDLGRHVRVAFTGDHGRKDMPILRDPERLPEVDYLISESTYGNREHGDRRLTLTEAAGIIQEEQRDGGRILVPAFSVGRTQNLLHALSNLTHEGLIPEIPIYVDSPLATKATRVAAAHRELYDDETQEMLERGRDPFYFDSVRFVADVEESKSLGELSEGIIISASGMCEAGRILHHLSRSLGQKRDCVLAAGYMAQGTLGRRLVDGHEIVRVFGVRHRVECKVRSVPGLSAHADWRELLESLGHLASSVRRVFVVHGEEDPAIRFSHRLLDAGFAEVEVPVHKQIFEL